MASGRTPSLILTGASHTVRLEDTQSAYPFASTTIRREYTERKTRDGASEAGQTVRVFRRWNGSEHSLRFTVPFCNQDNLDDLLDQVKANPPVVSVQHLGETFDADFIELTYKPNEFDFKNPDYTVQISLLRHSE